MIEESANRQEEKTSEELAPCWLPPVKPRFVYESSGRRPIMQKKDNAPNNQRKKSHIKSQVKVGSICARDDLQVFDDEQYTHVVYSWTRDRTAGVKSIFCAPAGCAKGNVSAHSLAFFP